MTRGRDNEIPAAKVFHPVEMQALTSPSLTPSVVVVFTTASVTVVPTAAVVVFTTASVTVVVVVVVVVVVAVQFSEPGVHDTVVFADVSSLQAAIAREGAERTASTESDRSSDLTL
jgi:hypothetical protein